MRVGRNRESGVGRRPALAATRTIVVATVLAATGGCAAGPGPSPSGTRYKGDAVWNISSADSGCSVHAATTSTSGSARHASR